MISHLSHLRKSVWDVMYFGNCVWKIHPYLITYHCVKLKFRKLHHIDPSSILFHTSGHIHIPFWEGQKRNMRNWSNKLGYIKSWKTLRHAMELELYLTGISTRGITWAKLCF